MEITDEMRLAVHREDCELLGHQPNIGTAFTSHNDTYRSGIVVQSADDTELPHISCDRCGLVWVVLPMAGQGYDDAERAVYSVLRPDADLARDITRRRGRRPARDRERARLAAREELEARERAERIAHSEEVASRRAARAETDLPAEEGT